MLESEVNGVIYFLFFNFFNGVLMTLKSYTVFPGKLQPIRGPISNATCQGLQLGNPPIFFSTYN